jgi:hypothetical protein
MCVRQTRPTNLRLVADNGAARRRATIASHDIEAGDLTDDELLLLQELGELESRLRQCRATGLIAPPVRRGGVRRVAPPARASL